MSASFFFIPYQCAYVSARTHIFSVVRPCTPRPSTISLTACTSHARTALSLVVRISHGGSRAHSALMHSHMPLAHWPSCTRTRPLAHSGPLSRDAAPLPPLHRGAHLAQPRISSSNCWRKRPLLDNSDIRTRDLRTDSFNASRVDSASVGYAHVQCD